MPKSTVLKPLEMARGSNDDVDGSHTIAAVVRHRLHADCPYAFYFRDVTFDFANGVLTIEGRVPSFYLRQVLISFVRELEQVEEIDDRLDVVSSTGLSSVRVG